MKTLVQILGLLFIFQVSVAQNAYKKVVNKDATTKTTEIYYTDGLNSNSKEGAYTLKIKGKVRVTGFFKNNKKYFFRQECKTHVDAMNFLMNKAFNEMEYDIIFNINLDDIYDKHRFEFQIRKVLLDNYDLVASNYEIFQNKNCLINFK